MDFGVFPKTLKTLNFFCAHLLWCTSKASPQTVRGYIEGAHSRTHARQCIVYQENLWCVDLDNM